MTILFCDFKAVPLGHLASTGKVNVPKYTLFSVKHGASSTFGVLQPRS